MDVIRRFRNWWNRDTLERAREESETHATPEERALAEEDFEARKDDVQIDGHAGGAFRHLEDDSSKE